MKVKFFFPHFAWTEQCYTPLCAAFDSVELELKPPFLNPGSATGYFQLLFV